MNDKQKATMEACPNNTLYYLTGGATVAIENYNEDGTMMVVVLKPAYHIKDVPPTALEPFFKK